MMNEIEQYLYENPELIERFMDDNKALLNEIKQRYADMFDSGDLVGRFLLSKALFEILQTATKQGQERLQHEMQGQGVNISSSAGSC